GELEREVRDSAPWRGPENEQRPEITSPAAIRGKPVELHSCEIDAHTLEHAPRLPLVPGGVHEDTGNFTGGERAYDLAVHPGDRRELAGPVAGVMRPSEPRGPMRLPLGRHTEAEGGRGVGAGERRGHYGWASRKRLPMPA